jgi:hypothetical protein
MASGEQVNNDYEEPGDSTNGGPILGVASTSNQTIEPKTNVPDEFSFGALPPEIRNRIYWYASVKSAPIHLAAAFNKKRFKWHDDATTSKLSGYGVPSITQTNKQFRQECLGVYYGMNKFVFNFNAHSQRSEKVCRRSLRDIIAIIGRSMRMMQPKAFEMRLTSTRRMDIASLRYLLACFVLMHLNGVRPTKDPNSRIIKTTTAVREVKEKATPISGVIRSLFGLSGHLCVQRCTNGEHAFLIGVNGERIEERKKRLFECSQCSIQECSDQTDCEIDCYIFCQKGQGKYFMRPDVHKFMSRLGLKRPGVRVCEIIRDSFRHKS